MTRKPAAAPEKLINTSITLPRDALALLRLVAARRANEHGGRSSISAVLASLVEASRPALEKEARGGK